MSILVTGSAGFIGNEVALRLLGAGHDVVGLDVLTPYYDVGLKESRLGRLASFSQFTEARIDLADQAAVERLFAEHKPERVVHLAAQAGVRYSLENAHSYGTSNLTGFLNVLEGCRHHSVGHLVFASSSSVYGANAGVPSSVHQSADHPVSLYGATKKANELMAHSYSHLFNLPTTGLRLFTVYGPWGRPDMALFLFTEAILAGRPIDVYNEGRMTRDFTYIDDAVDAVLAVLEQPPEPDKGWSAKAPDPATSGVAPYRLYNVGNNKPVTLLDFIALLEDKLGTTAEKNLMPLQPGDVTESGAEADDLYDALGVRAKVGLGDGIGRFVDWYRDFYGV